MSSSWQCWRKHLKKKRKRKKGLPQLIVRESSLDDFTLEICWEIISEKNKRFLNIESLFLKIFTGDFLEGKHFICSLKLSLPIHINIFYISSWTYFMFAYHSRKVPLKSLNTAHFLSLFYCYCFSCHLLLLTDCWFAFFTSMRNCKCFKFVVPPYIWQKSVINIYGIQFPHNQNALLFNTFM